MVRLEVPWRGKLRIGPDTKTQASCATFYIEVSGNLRLPRKIERISDTFGDRRCSQIGFFYEAMCENGAIRISRIRAKEGK